MNWKQWFRNNPGVTMDRLDAVATESLYAAFKVRLCEEMADSAKQRVDNAVHNYVFDGIAEVFEEGKKE